MAKNLFIQLIARLNKSLSKTQIQSDLNDIEKTPFYIRVIARLNKSLTRRNIENSVQDAARNISVDVNARVSERELQQSYETARQNLENRIQNDPIEIPVNVDTEGIQQGQHQIHNLNNEARNARNIFTEYLNAREIFRAIANAIKMAVNEVKELNKAQTDLQMVTEKSNSEMTSLMGKYNNLAKNLSVTTKNITSSADEWLRQGKSVAETDELIKDSVILAKVGQIEAADATKYLTSAMNGFKTETSDVIGIVDKLTNVDLESATSAGGLAEAMSKCANSAEVAGVSMDSLIGYIATVAEVTQKSDSVVGESFKSILARMGKIKLNNWIDEDGKDISGEINDVEKTLAQFDIKLRNSATEFRNFEDVIYDVGMAWDKFSSVDQNAIANAFGGVYQRENVITLFENFSRALELSEVSANSAGTAYQKFEVYENSLEAATNRLTASFESLAYNTIDASFISNLANATASIVEFVDSTQLIKTGLTAGIFTGAIVGLTALGARMIVVRNNITQFTQAMNLSRSSTAMVGAQYNALENSVRGLTEAQLRLVLSSRQLTEAQRLDLMQDAGIEQARQRQLLQTWNLTNATNAETVATFSLRGAWEGLKASIASNPMGLVITALTLATTAISNYNQKQEEARKNAVESAEKYEEQATSLASLRQEYINIVDSESDVSKKTEELNKWKETLIETYGFEKEAIEKVNLEREKGLGLLDDEITKNRINSAETWLTENKDSYEDAKKKLTSRNNSSENAVIPQANVITQVTKDALNDFSDNFNDILKQFSISNPTKDNPLAQIKLKGSNTLEQYENLNEILNEITSIKVTKGLNDAEEKFYNSLLAKQKAYKKVVTDDIKDIYETGNKYTNAIKLFNFETDNGINFDNVTQDTYKEFRDKFLESLGLGDKKDSTAFSLDIEQVLLDMMPDFEKSYRGIEDSVSDEIQNVADATAESNETASKSLEDLQKAYDDLSKSASNFTKVQKTFTSALEEQEKHGQLSASTIQELTDAGYAQALVVDSETGAVTLNKQAYEQLNKQKRKAIELDLEAEKSDLVTQLNEEKNAIADLTKEYEALNQVPNKTQDITDRISAITLELTKRGENITAISELIDKINGSVTSLDAPEFGSDKTEKPQSVLDFEAEYAEKQHEFNMDQKEKNEDYYSWLLSAAHTAYDGLADYQDDLWKYEEEVYKGRKQLADNFYDEQQNDFEDRISSLEDDIDKAMDGKLTSLVSQSDIDNLNELNQTMQELYQLGNVDLTKRPKVSADAMRKAGYDAEDGETATVYSSFDFLWQGDEEHGKYVAVHYTPILPDGTVLDEKTLNDYLNTLVGSDDILKADTKGIILKVDSDVDVSDADVKSLETDKPTENIQNITKACDDWDIALHNIQAEWMVLDEAVNNASEMHIEDKFEYIRSGYQEILNEIDGRINEIVQGGVEGHEDDLKKLEERRVKYSDKLAELPKTAAEEEQTYIKKLKDDYSDLYDERIKKLKKQKEATEKAFKAEIDAIQKKIDALKDANDKEQEALDIEKARKELEKASQSTRQVYGSDGSISFKVDDEKVKEAQENLDKLMQEKQINILEKQKQALEDVKTKESEAYDSIIDNLETEKDNSEKRFDILLDVLDKYLNPDQGESNSDVWKMLAHLEGATYKNGVWTDKDGKAIDIDKLVNTVETAKKEDKQTDTENNINNGNTSNNTKDNGIISGNITRLSLGSNNAETDNVANNITDKIETGIVDCFTLFEKKYNIPSGSLTLDKVSSVLNGSFLMRYNDEPFKHQSDVGINEKYSSNVNNNKNNNSVSFNGDIVINNPVSNSDDLAKELMLNIPIAFQKQMYSNLGR